MKRARRRRGLAHLARLVAPIAVAAPACDDGTPPSAARPAVPGFAAIACGPGETPTATGDCRAAGVLPEECGEGFVADGRGGCDPILPPAPCDDGTVAFLGDTACHEIADCGDGTWGDVPVDATTVFVDAAAPSAGANGSRDAPWPTLTQAIAAAPNGATIALAAGTYTGASTLVRPVHIWGRCPRLVELTAVTPEVNGNDIMAFARGSEGSSIHTLRVAVPSTTATRLGAFTVYGTGEGAPIAFDRVDVVGCESTCLSVNSGPPAGIAATVDGSRFHTAAYAARVLFNAAPGTVVVRRSIVLGDLTSPSQIGVDTENGLLQISGTIVDGMTAMGVFVEGADAEITDCLVRDTGASLQSPGAGVQLFGVHTRTSRTTIRGSVFERNAGGGVAIACGDLDVASTTIRDSAPSAATIGIGIDVEQDLVQMCASTLTLRSSLLERNGTVGLAIRGSTATIESTIVRAPLTNAHGVGRGVDVRYDDDVTTGAIFPASATISGSVVDGAHDAAIVVVGADVALTRVALRSTNAFGDAYGDGLDVGSGVAQPAHVQLVDSLVVGSSRAAIATFGEVAGVLATVEIHGDVIDRNAIDLDREGAGASLVDQGGNVCVAPEGTGRACQAASTGLSPPQAITP